MGGPMRGGDGCHLVRSYLSITGFLAVCATAFGVIEGLSGVAWFALVAIVTLCGVVLTAAQEVGRRRDSGKGEQ
jgi:hypothetical protein